MAVTLEELQIKFTAEMGNLNSQLNGIKQSIGGIEKPAGKAQSALSKFAPIGKMITGAAIGAKLVGIGKEALDMANDVVESESLFAVSFGDMADSVTEWSKDLSDSLGVNEYEARKTAGVLNTMFKSMGLGKQEAVDMSQSMVELANDMASFYNLDIEEAFTKLRAGITGEAEPLKQLGILVDETTVKHYALKEGLIAQGEEMTAQQKIQARYIAIMAQTGDAHGDLARTMDSPSNQLRRLNNEFDMAKIALGQALQPALLAVLPVLTNLATGAGDVIKALSGVGGEKSAFEEVAITVDEGREILKSSLDTSTSELVTKIESLDSKVDKALSDFVAAEKRVKKVEIQIELDPPTTTGKERIVTALDELRALVPVEIDTDPIIAKLDVITEDGEVTEKEKGSMSQLLNTWSEKTIKAIQIDAKNKIKEIDALVKAGKISEEEAGELKAAVEAKANEAIANVTAVVGVVNAEIGAGGDSLTKVSFSPEQAAKLGELLSTQANTHEIAVTAEVDRVEATWTGSGTIGDTVIGIYTEAEAAFIAKNAELKALAEKMLTGVSTDEMWDDAIRIKEEIRQLTEFMFTDNADYGAIFAQNFDIGSMQLSIKNALIAIEGYVATESEASKTLVNQKIGDIMSLPPDVFEAKFPGRTPAQVIAEIRQNAADELSEKSNAPLLALARMMMPSIVEAIKSEDVSIQISAVYDLQYFLDSLDLDRLSVEAKQEILDMLNSIEIPKGEGFQNVFGGENPFQYTIDELVASIDLSKVAQLGTDAMNTLRSALEDGSISAETYRQVISANAEGTLAELPEKFRGSGQESTARFVEGLLSNQDAVKEAGTAVSDVSVDGLATNPENAKTEGENKGQQYADGVASKSGVSLIAGETVSDASIDGMALGDAAATSEGENKGQKYNDGLVSKNGTVVKSGIGISDASVKGFTDGGTGATQAGENKGQNFIDGLVSKEGAAKDAGLRLYNAVVNGLDGGRGGSFDSGANAGDSFVSGLSSKTDAAAAAGRALGIAAKNAMNGVLKIGSPSKVTTEFGEYFGQGFINGIYSQTSAVAQTAGGLASTAINSMNGSAVAPTLGIENGSIVQQAINGVMDRLNITLNVDGETWGRATVKHINSVQRASGKILLEM